ncbi:unnamed protein product [Macrosiphum euphorbiae]|uniref:Uncharacterized protein n=1 Tax=Macrosiphum euphorbiae TaxID=13131 RepID=A0AAV0WT34_9HEMI|nr:unnamed protein product [Macrosiphum euphorbiae]
MCGVNLTVAAVRLEGADVAVRYCPRSQLAQGRWRLTGLRQHTDFYKNSRRTLDEHSGYSLLRSSYISHQEDLNLERCSLSRV